MSLQTRLTAFIQAVGADIKALNTKVNVVTKVLDPWHTVGAAGEPPFQNGWINYNTATYPPLQFRKDIFGKVQMRGAIKNGTLGSTVFTLPSGYKPPAGVLVSFMSYTSATTFAAFQIDPTGATACYYRNDFCDAAVIEFDTDTVTELSVMITGAAQGAVPIDAWKTVGADGGATTFVNNWVSYGGAYPLQYRKLPNGEVQMRGLAKGGAGGAAATASAVFTFPPDHVPSIPNASAQFFEATAYGGSAYVDSTKLQVAFNGTVTSTYLCPAGGFVSFDTVRFPTAQATWPTGPQGPKGDTGGVNVLVTLNWNTAITTGFYRSTNDGLLRTINGPGDTVNPPPQAGIVTVHESGALVQRVWDLSMQVAYTRYENAVGDWSSWIADLTKPPLWTDVMIGGAAPKDGDERYFQNAAMKAQSALWKLRYNAGSTFTNKWENAGGSEYRSKATAGYTCVSPNSWELVAAATFPRWTCPLSGVYRVKYGCRFQQMIVGGVEGYMGLGLTTSSSPIDSIRFNAGQNAAGVDIHHMDYEFEATFTEGQILALMHNTQTVAGNVNYTGQFMLIAPLRTV